jgi:hypothetical protein
MSSAIVDVDCCGTAIGDDGDDDNIAPTTLLAATATFVSESALRSRSSGGRLSVRACVCVCVCACVYIYIYIYERVLGQFRIFDA